MYPINLFPKSFSQLSSLANYFRKFSQIRCASTHQLVIHHHRGSRKYSSDDQPPPEFPAAPQPNKPYSESSEVPSAPDFPDDPTPKKQYRGDPYGSGAAIPQQRPKSKVRQPHGAEVKTPLPPESDNNMVSY